MLEEMGRNNWFEVGAPKLLCLRREYLQKKETNAPLRLNRGGFSLYGHRLSSLFRIITLISLWLMNYYVPSFFYKYSNSTLTKESGT